MSFRTRARALSRTRALVGGRLARQLALECLASGPLCAATLQRPRRGLELVAQVEPGVLASAARGAREPSRPRPEGGASLLAGLRGGQECGTSADGQAERQAGPEDGDPLPVGLVPVLIGLRRARRRGPSPRADGPRGRWRGGLRPARRAAIPRCRSCVGHVRVRWRSVLVWKLRRTGVVGDLRYFATSVGRAPLVLKGSSSCRAPRSPATLPRSPERDQPRASGEAMHGY